MSESLLALYQLIQRILEFKERASSSLSLSATRPKKRLLTVLENRTSLMLQDLLYLKKSMKTAMITYMSLLNSRNELMLDDPTSSILLEGNKLMSKELKYSMLVLPMLQRLIIMLHMRLMFLKSLPHKPKRMRIKRKNKKKRIY